MKRVGIPTCPIDASEEIKAISSYISNYKGGEACARDVIEQVLRAQGKWLIPEAFEW
jgi:3-deoxy-D-manno-octulosonate 8-phosphate phosphatase (KDO 8-P phosphatase)